MSRKLSKDELAENQIIEVAVENFVKSGHLVSVHNGEDLSCPPTDDVARILGSLRATDSDQLLLHRDGRQTSSYLLLVYGNEPYEVMADWTLDVEDMVAPAARLAEELEMA